MSLVTILRTILFASLLAATLPGHVRAQELRIPAVETPLADARRGFVTKIIHRKQTILDPPKPPKGFRLVEYPAPLGNYPAYMTVPETTGKRYPAIWSSLARKGQVRGNKCGFLHRKNARRGRPPAR